MAAFTDGVLFAISTSGKDQRMRILHLPLALVRIRGCANSQAIMPTRYYGVFCPKGHFIQIGTYPIEHPDSPYGGSLTLNHAEEFRCGKCGDISSYQQSDIAYSNSPDGKEAEYPFRDEESG